jgi:hypothetical protein
MICNIILSTSLIFGWAIVQSRHHSTRMGLARYHPCRHQAGLAVAFHTLAVMAMIWGATGQR